MITCGCTEMAKNTLLFCEKDHIVFFAVPVYTIGVSSKSENQD